MQFFYIKNYIIKTVKKNKILNGVFISTLKFNFLAVNIHLLFSYG